VKEKASEVILLTAIYEARCLDHSDGVIGVEHDSNHSADGSGRKVLVESGPDHAVVSMRIDNLAPDASEPGVALGVLSLVYVSNSLSQVKACLFPIFDSFDLNSSLVLMSVSLSPLETEESSLNVKPKRSQNDHKKALTSLVEFYARFSCPFLLL
jgi:hypothetical protein